MKTTDLFKERRVFSFEIFPPKPNSPIDTIYKTLDGLKNLKPDFISVTYGAAGGNNNRHTFQIASDIKKKYGIEGVAHLSGMGLNKAETLEKLNILKELGIDNILALKGNPPVEPCKDGDFQYASDLIAFIKEHGDFNILAACYPEGHIESKSLEDDIKWLKHKVDVGASHLVSQLFFDNSYFYDFLEKARKAGINVPIEAGIMPVTNKKQIERMVSLCGATLPEKFLKIMARFENKPEAMRDAGIAYAVDQIVDLIANKVDGIHLYTMNNPYIATRISQAVGTLINS